MSQPSASYEDILNKDILELMGAKDMSEERKKELYTKMLETIQNRVIVKIINQLSDEDAEAFKKLVDSGNKTEMENFLNSREIDLAQLMLAEAMIYKTEMVSLKNAANKEE